MSDREDVASQATDFVVKWDENRDARIDKQEWQAMMRRSFPDVPDGDRNAWGERDFDEFDSSRDGFITSADLITSGLEGFDCMDANRNGRLSDAERHAGPNASCPVITK